MTLLDLQNDFIDYVLDRPNTIPAAVRSDGLPGLDVYHNAYRGQLLDCLKDSYERIWAWLGDDAFEQAARRHIAGHTPSSWTLGDYGVGFARTLAELYDDDPEVAEIAALDWALRRAFDGPDGAAFDPQRLDAVNWEEAVFHFSPTLTILPVITNCGAIWNALAAGSDVPAAQLLPANGWIRVWRIDLQPHFATIDDGEYRAIQLAMSGMSFARICDCLATDQGITDATEAAGRYLASWLQDQAIMDIR